MTTRIDPTASRPSPFPKDTTMHHRQTRLATVLERESFEQSIRDFQHERRAASRPFRARLGESLIRLGRRVAGDSVSTPAWTD